MFEIQPKIGPQATHSWKNTIAELWQEGLNKIGLGGTPAQPQLLEVRHLHLNALKVFDPDGYGEMLIRYDNPCTRAMYQQSTPRSCAK